MKKLLSYSVVILLMFVSICVHAQEDSLHKYREQYQQQFMLYGDSIQRGFDEMLKQRWIEMEVYRGERYMAKPSPNKQPLMDTGGWDNEALLVGKVLQVNYCDSMSVSMASILVPKEIRSKRFDFYGRLLEIKVAASLEKLHLRGVSEWDVSRMWGSLESSSCWIIAQQVLELKRKLQLNDWGMYDLICHVTKMVYPNQDNEQVILKVYLLNKLGYEAKMGRQGQCLVSLLNFESVVYDVPYMMINHKRYYVYGQDDQMSTNAKVYTYRMVNPNTVRGLDLMLYRSPLLGSEDMVSHYQFKIANQSIDFSVEKELMRFYNAYPQTELQYYSNASVSASFEAQVDIKLLPLVAMKSHMEAVNMLLDYMQRGFAYQHDVTVHGKERTFFCEENFYYGTNDCEDRAVLFAYLVQHLLQLDVLLAVYSNHVVVGVCFADDVTGNYYQMGGRRYVVCDPTYIGGQVGQLSKKYLREHPSLIKVERN